MIVFLVLVGTALAALPVVLTVINSVTLRTPPLPADTPRVSILIPARDEEGAIGPCVEAALASVGVEFEVIVLDDGSTDATSEVVRARMASEPRLRLEAAPPKPEGWKGKPHACQVLSERARHPNLLFVDADVRLAPEAAARLCAADADLVSGVPRQVLGSWLEAAVVPMINGLLLGYLPMPFMRRSPREALGTAVGQMLRVRALDYRAVGGHAAVAAFMHDGLRLARLFRHKGFRTDLVDGTGLATCRMYDNPSALWQGFLKNATEGMATPVALPIWTVLLAGGQLLPWLSLALVAASERLHTGLGLLAAIAPVALLAAWSVQAVKAREPWFTVPLRPLGVVLTLAIQWQALIGFLQGRPVTWRGRAYDPRM